MYLSLLNLIFGCVFRYKRVGYLEIDGTEVVEGTSPGALSQLNTKSLIYIGMY